ncbi:hypothetical protein AAHC03_024431 [Spirometra sp. Aus1]
MSSVNHVPILVHSDVLGIPAQRCSPGTRILKVNVVRGSSLMKKDIFGTSDPYCRISLYRDVRQTTIVGNSVRTKTIKRSLNPFWNEEFYFRVNPESSRLLFEIFDENRITRDDFLGLVAIHLPQLDIRTEPLESGRLAAKNFLLRPRSVRSRVKGKLLLALSYLPDTLDVCVSQVPTVDRACIPRHSLPVSPTTAVATAAAFNGAPVRLAQSHSADMEVTQVANESGCGDDDAHEPALQTSMMPDNEPLPEGWDERIDQNGRTYYVDHINRRTQWDRPLSRLPDGWEQRTDVNGRVYYLDHINQRTTWYSPLSVHAIQESEAWVEPPGSVSVHTRTDDTTETSTGTPSPANDMQTSTINGSQSDTEATSERPSSGSQHQLRSQVTQESRQREEDAEVDESTRTRRLLRRGQSTTTATLSRPPPRLLVSAGPTPEEEVQAAQTMYLRRHQVRVEDTTPRPLAESALSPGPGQQQPNANMEVSLSETDTTLSCDAMDSVPTDGVTLPEANTVAPCLVAPIASSPDALVTATVTVVDSRGERVSATVEDSHAAAVAATRSPISIVSPTPASSGATASASNASLDTEGLPPGWQVALTANGRPFFINHNDQTTTWDDPRKRPRTRASRDRENSTPAAEAVAPAPSVLAGAVQKHSIPALGPLPPGWEERVHTNGRIFYINHNARTTQWEDPRLERLGGPAVPYSRNYRQKYEYFRSRLRAPRDVQAKFEIRVTRQGIFEDSFRLIYSIKKPEVLMHRLWIEFLGEKGLDYGGVQREWFFLLSRQMFNPYYGLFEYSAADNYTLQINPLSGLANDDHLRYFKFIGRVCGMAVYHGKLVDGFFIRPFYKMMLGKKITLKDMEAVDSEYYRSLKYILESDPRDLGLTFSVDEEHFGQTVEVDLVENGRNLPVTNANKREYIEKIINWRFVSRVEHQMCAFLEGFNDLIPLETLQLFDANELELLMCGLQDISVQDWKANTLYKGEYNANHSVIINFWKTLYTFTNELRSRLLQFVTGTSRVPMNGFVELWGSTGPQKFTIESWGTVDQLPRAHTCFNRLDLPPYPTFEELRCKLIIAIENAEGFEGVD